MFPRHRKWSHNTVASWLSRGASDFREITSLAAGGDERALLGLEVWAWRIRHYIGAYAALLGGVDALVFTGGIGEKLWRRKASGNTGA